MIRAATLALLLTGCAMAKDQGQHLTAGMAVGGLTYSVTRNPFHACMASTAAGVAKEAYDSTGRGTVDGMDVVYTAVPSCVVWYVFDRFAGNNRD